MDYNHFGKNPWSHVSRKSQSRLHGSLLMNPGLLNRQRTVYTDGGAGAGASAKLRSLDTSITIVQNDHITPEWYHLTLQKVESKQNRISSKSIDINELEQDKSIMDTELEETCKLIAKACKLRDKWLYHNIRNNGHIGSLVYEQDWNVNKMKNKLPKSIENQYSYKFENGVSKIYSAKDNKEIFDKSGSFDEYLTDLNTIFNLMSYGPAKTFCYKRLKILQCRFKLHLLLNHETEATESSSVPYRDFYNVRKIDNHIHHSASMHQKHLLKFIKDKYKKDKNKIMNKNNQTLKEMFDELNVNVELLSVDKLDVHAQQATFQRFDKFNAKYNPIGQRPLRTLFLKIDNYINGKYLADITREVINELEYQKYQFVEYRLSIYGKKKEEWNIVSNWICNNNLYSHQVRWLIQVPRIYPIFKKKGLLNNFNEMLSNIFEPLFEVTLNPSKYPSLHLFLSIIVGFDSVDDESTPESMDNTSYPPPNNWNNSNNPPYIYYMYYMYINILKLNKLRELRGLNVFAFRPHSGEAGSLNHLASTFLLAQSINHGIRLRYSPILQYLYYLKQIGISSSPLSNNILFEEYERNPFPLFFERGLNITLSTDDPLLIHYTKDALLEEYSIAAQVYNLSAIDLCEIARNSVLQCGWDHKQKQEWIGYNYHDKTGADANDIYRTNVPNTRIQFRHLLLKEERMFIKSNGNDILSRSKFFLDNIFNDNDDIDDDDDNKMNDNDNIQFFQNIQNELHANKNKLDGLVQIEEDNTLDDDIDDIKDNKDAAVLSLLSPVIPGFGDDLSRKSLEDTVENKNKNKIKKKVRFSQIISPTRYAKKLINKIDRLITIIDNLNDGSTNTTTVGNDKILIINNDNDNSNVFNKNNYIETPFGDGIVLNENKDHYEIEMNQMIALINKNECKLMNTNVCTPLGNGIIIDSNGTHYTVQLNNMIASINKSECKQVNSNASSAATTAPVILLRDIYDIDLERVYELEMNGYPADEAATKEKLFYRFIFAKRYFRVLTLNSTVIGFICGTKAMHSTLTDETMSKHNKNGKHLCIHSVVIDKKYQRNGYGTKMMKEYVKQEIGSFINNSLESMRLICKKHLINFYKNCGFKLIGKSDVVHGKDPWYEMMITITHE